MGGGGSGSPARMAAGASVTIHSARAGATRAAASTPALSRGRAHGSGRVGVAGDVVGKAVPDQVERESAGSRLAIGRDERRQGDLDQDAALHQAGQACRVALEGDAALGMRQQDAETALGQAEEEILEVVGQRAVGGLHEQVAAALVERGEAQVLLGGGLGPEQVDLGRGDHAHAELGRHALVHAGAGVGQIADVHAGVVLAQMRGRGQRGRALVGRRANDRHALLDVVRAVVYAGQHMGMKVDHQTHCPVKAPRARPAT